VMSTTTTAKIFPAMISSPQNRPSSRSIEQAAIPQLAARHSLAFTLL
jgi:hypothetical protein